MPMASLEAGSAGNTLLVLPATGKPLSSMSVIATWKSAPPIEWYWLSRPMMEPEL